MGVQQRLQASLLRAPTVHIDVTCFGKTGMGSVALLVHGSPMVALPWWQGGEQAGDE